MKYIDYPELESLSRALTFESTECKVFTRLEAYSCKAVNKEKRLYKALENAYQQTASTSPPHYLDEALASPFGRLDQPNARKTLFLLIALLNGAFPDHDFSEVNPSDFRKEPSPAVVLQSLSSTLASLRGSTEGPRSYSTFTGSFDAARHDHARASSSYPSGRDGQRQSGSLSGASHAGLTSLLDEIMDIRECDVFTFHPDVDSDPHACAEPEEEGPRFADDGYWSDDGDAQMQSVNYITPKKEIIDVDTPMFDEDYSGGFESQSASQKAQTKSAAMPGPQTPQTPNMNDSPARLGKAMPTKSVSREDYFYTGGSMSSASSIEAEEDEDVDGNGGLLWSTFAFFFNRRLKRILFVSVWSRRNASLGQTQTWTSPSMQYEQMSSIPPSLSLPPQMSGPASKGAGEDSNGKPSADFSREQSTEGTPLPSPAKMAMARTTRLGAARGRRNGSGSPAPSSMSPFPHASPHRGPPAADRSEGLPTSTLKSGSTASARRPSTSRTPNSANRPFNSLSGAALSISAPPSSSSSSSSRSAHHHHPYSHHPYSSSSSSSSSSANAKRPSAPPMLAPVSGNKRRS